MPPRRELPRLEPGSRQPAARDVAGEAGVTLMELLVAMLILVMVSGLLYSVLNVGVSFSRKGEVRTRQFGRERALLELLHRQVHGAWFDQKQKKPSIETAVNQLKLITTAPLLNRDLDTVLAVYLYDPREDTLYYTEKKDFYNADYRGDYRADRREMLVLVREVGGMDFDYQGKTGELKVVCRNRGYTMPVRCWLPEGAR